MTRLQLSYRLGVLGISTLIITALVWWMPSFEQKEDDVRGQSRPNNGWYQSYHDNGEVKALEYYTNGLKDSTWFTYYENGMTKQVIPYDLGKYDGVMEFYAEDGSLIYTERYTEGVFLELLVENDSLYKYQVNLMAHGKALFNRSCNTCHSAGDSPITDFSVLSGISDSLTEHAISIDSMHVVRLDSIIFRMYPEGKEWFEPPAMRTLDKYDVDALLYFLESEQEKPGKLPFRRIRELWKKNKVVQSDASGPSRVYNAS